MAKNKETPRTTSKWRAPVEKEPKETVEPVESEIEPSEPDVDVDGEKPLPPAKRPGTSGTENLLITNRRQASQQLARARRAEEAYRARKHAALARQNYDETRNHFREAASHLRLGLRGVVAVIRGIPYLVREKREERRRKDDARQRQRALEKKRRLEEALAREESDGVGPEEKAAE
ncbi:hypothetical protein DL768_000433 [Monosporascus sp. mg162]|nr:hypothetical protein DL768_000433 [Monosporascus sp. mg162]